MDEQLYLVEYEDIYGQGKHCIYDRLARCGCEIPELEIMCLHPTLQTSRIIIM